MVRGRSVCVCVRVCVERERVNMSKFTIVDVITSDSREICFAIFETHNVKCSYISFRTYMDIYIHF